MRTIKATRRGPCEPGSFREGRLFSKPSRAVGSRPTKRSRKASISEGEDDCVVVLAVGPSIAAFNPSITSWGCTAQSLSSRTAASVFTDKNGSSPDGSRFVQ